VSAGLRLAVAVATVVAVVAIAGCHGSSDTAGQPAPATVSSSAPAPVTPTGRSETADRAAVEAAYRRFWQLSRTFDQRYPPRRWRQVLAAVAVDPELGLILANAELQRRNGILLYGQVIPRPAVAPVHGGDRATVLDCEDASHAGQADARTGQRKTVGVARNPVVAVLLRGRDGAWRVSSVRFPGGRC
jgi:hypothetical protein